MRLSVRFILMALLGFYAISPTPSRATDSPYASWDSEQIEADRKESKKEIQAKMRQWLEARKSLLVDCKACRGSGKGRPYRGRPGECASCRGKRTIADWDKFQFVHLDLHTPAARGNRAVEELLQGYFFDESTWGQRRFFGQIKKGRVKSIDVLGNHARIVFFAYTDSGRSERQMQWVRVGEHWYIHEEGRQLEPLRLIDYPQGEPKAGESEESAAGQSPASPPPPALIHVEIRPQALQSAFAAGAVENLREEPGKDVLGNPTQIMKTSFTVVIRNIHPAKQFGFLLCELKQPAKLPLPPVSKTAHLKNFGPGARTVLDFYFDSWTSKLYKRIGPLEVVVIGSIEFP